jgi:hypothetical protein
MQHTPRVVDDFVDVDTHFVRMCMCVCVWRQVKREWCMSLDVFVHK